MVLLPDIANLEGVLGFLAWTLALFGLTKLLFRSFLAEEFGALFARYEAPYLMDMRKLRWELRNNSVWNPRSAEDGDPLASRVRLTEQQRKTKETILHALRWRSLPRRMVRFFFGCVFCQASWTALVLGLFWWKGLVAWFASGMLYGTSVLLLAQLGKPCGGKHNA